MRSCSIGTCLSWLLKDHSGPDLSAGKRRQIESRLLPLARKADLADIGCFVQKMKAGSAALIAPAVEAMATNETFFRDKLNAISDNDATLTVEGSIQGLNLKEFFLLLSSTGPAYRRCEIVRVNGSEMDIRFLKARTRNARAAPTSGMRRLTPNERDRSDSQIPCFKERAA